MSEICSLLLKPSLWFTFFFPNVDLAEPEAHCNYDAIVAGDAFWFVNRSFTMIQKILRMSVAEFSAAEDSIRALEQHKMDCR